MKRKLKKGLSTKADVVYDDDTDSSDSEDLQSFRQSFKAKQKGSARKYSSSDADDEVNENTSDDDDSSETESNLSSDGDSSDEENGSRKGNEKNEKLEKLQNQLTSLDKVAISTRRVTEENDKEGQPSNPAIPENEFNADSAIEKSTFPSKTSANEQSTTHDQERVI